MTENVKRYKLLGGTEKALQNYCMERLQALENAGKCYFFRANSFAGLITRYNGSQGFVNNAKRGMPDIVCCFPRESEFYDSDDSYVGAIEFGQFVGLEIKGPNGKQGPEQKLAQEKIEHVGGEYFIIQCPEDFENLIQNI